MDKDVEQKLNYILSEKVFEDNDLTWGQAMEMFSYKLIENGLSTVFSQILPNGLLIRLVTDEMVKEDKKGE